jgi:hypothetical protein
VKKKVLLFVLIGLIGTGLLATVCFYSLAFNQLNNLIIHVNSNDESAYGDTDWVSGENLRALDVTDGSADKETHYMDIQTKKSIESISLNQIVFLCDVHVSAKDEDTWETVKEFSGKRKVTFVFTDFVWVVEDVQAVE